MATDAYCNKVHFVNLNIRPIHANEYIPSVSAPHLVGGFSVSAIRLYEKWQENLRFFVPPLYHELPIDLRQGIDQVKHKADATWTEGLNHILEFIIENMEQFIQIPMFGGGGRRHKLNADFVCSRDVIEKLMTTPYEHKKNWRLLVTNYNGTIYICQQDTEQEERARLDLSDFNEKLCEAWNYKLRQHCMSSNYNEKPISRGPIEASEEFNCVYEMTMDGLKLLYNSEMQGAHSMYVSEPLNLMNLKFVQLKLRLASMNRDQWIKYNRNDALKWWCESYLTGIDNVFVGMHDEYGVVHKIEEQSIRKLRKEANEWTWSVCSNFLLRFLRTIKTIMGTVDDPSTVYQFSFNAQNSTISYIICKDRTEYTIIPDWYAERMENIHT